MALRQYRGRALAGFDVQTRRNIQACRSIKELDLDLDTALAVWVRALELPRGNGNRSGPPPGSTADGQIGPRRRGDKPYLIHQLAVPELTQLTHGEVVTQEIHRSCFCTGTICASEVRRGVMAPAYAVEGEMKSSLELV